MKRILIMIGVMIMLFGFSGCGPLRSRTALLNSDYKTEAEAIKEAETTIIEALNRKDRELLKSVFSEDALSKDPAMEDGIDYLFDLYEGDFIEVTYRNHSSEDHWGEPGRTKRIEGWFDIKTSKAVYQLYYDLWSIQEQKTAKKGIYAIQLCKEREYPAFYSMAGVQTPERACVNKTIDAFYNSFKEKDVTKLKVEFSEQLLNTEDLDEKINEIMQLFGYGTVYSDVKGIWTTDTSTESQRQRHVFMEINDTPTGDYILYFRYEDWENDKISIIKVTKIEEGKTEYDYDLGEELTEPGIYLP